MPEGSRARGSRSGGGGVSAAGPLPRPPPRRGRREWVAAGPALSLEPLADPLLAGGGGEPRGLRPPVPPLPPGRRCRSVRARGPAVVKAGAAARPRASPRRRGAAASCPVTLPPRGWGLAARGAPSRGRGDPLAACDRRAPGEEVEG